MMLLLYILLHVVGAYLLGSVSFAVLTSKVFGLADPRTYGSGNPGATNVLRSGKKMAAALTLLGDAAKGWLAVWWTMRGLGSMDMDFIDSMGGLDQWTMGNLHVSGMDVIALVAIAVFLGHLFPIFLRFKGGKGVATALGVLLGLDVWVGLLVLATWLVVALVSRYSSLSALVAAVAAPFYAWWWNFPEEWLFAVVVISLLLTWRHRSNIKNLLAGTESRIGSKKVDSQA